MSLDTTISRNEYVGTGLVSEYEYTFKIFDKTHLIVITKNLANVETILECDIDYTVAGVGEKNGGAITLTAGPLDEDFVITIFRVLPITQGTDIKNQRDFYPEIHEMVFDRMTMVMQQLQALADRSIKLPPTTNPAVFDTQLPTELEEDHTLILGPNGFSIVLGPTPAQLSNAAVAADEALQAAADAQAAAIAAQEAADAALAIGVATVSGYSTHYGETVNLTGIENILNYAFGIEYAGPSISVSASGSTTVREKGTVVASTTLTATVTKKSDPIANVKFYQGATLLETQTSGGAVPSGGTSTYVYSTPFSDNISFSATTTDDGATGGPSTPSAGVSFVFVYPYYSGVGAAGLNAAGIAALTKDVRVSTATLVKSFTVNGSQKMYFAQPASYADLAQILDVNNFDTLPDWTKSTKTITGLDGTPQSYTCYEFNNIAVAGTFPYTFKR